MALLLALAAAGCSGDEGGEGKGEGQSDVERARSLPEVTAEPGECPLALEVVREVVDPQMTQLRAGGICQFQVGNKARPLLQVSWQNKAATEQRIEMQRGNCAELEEVPVAGAEVAFACINPVIGAEGFVAYDEYTLTLEAGDGRPNKSLPEDLDDMIELLPSVLVPAR